MDRKSKIKEKLKQKLNKSKKNYILNTEELTDKFCMLWCCKDFYNQCTEHWNIKILFESHLGIRYFIKFESMDKKLTQTCSKVITDAFVYFTDIKNKTDPIEHFGFVLKEEAPYCISKFADHYKGTVCVDEKCNQPNLTIFEKQMCVSMCCIDCGNEACSSTLKCNKLIPSVLQMKHLNKQIEDNVNKKDAELHYPEIINKLNLTNKLPNFLKIN